MDLFRKIGDELEQRWRQCGYAGEAFTDLAVASLERADELGQIGTWEILRWIARAPVLPAQADPESHFGDLAVTLYETPRFFVSALMWLDGTTAIHQHGFSGAFRVLTGGSLHTRYHFQEQRLVTPGFRLGRLEREGAELLTSGSVRPIASGEGLIHSLFHLDRPSVTVVVRTGADEGSQPQWSYLAPGIAFDPFSSDAMRSMKIAAVRVLLNLDAEAADVELCEILAAADLQTTFKILGLLFDRLGNSPMTRAFAVATDERWPRLLAAARQRHGSVIELFEQAFHEQRREHEIIDIRKALTTPEHRFLLALLLNVPDRGRVLELIAQRYPERDPVDQVIDWIDELSNLRVLGSLAPNVLRLPEFELEHLTVLRCLLRGGSAADAAADLAATLAGEDPPGVRELASQIVTSFRTTSLLRAMLQPM